MKRLEGGENKCSVRALDNVVTRYNSYHPSADTCVINTDAPVKPLPEIPCLYVKTRR